VKEEETLILLTVLNEKLTINSFKAIRKVTKEFHEGIKPIKISVSSAYRRRTFMNVKQKPDTALN